MLDVDRIASIEAVITAQEAAGKDWTNQSIYNAIGGNYGELAQYLKARRARARVPGREGGAATAVAEAEVEAQAPPTKQEELDAARLAFAHASGRVAQLRSQGDTHLLSDAEETELLRLQARLERMQPVLARLHTELLAQQEHTDVEAFRQGWQPLVDAKVQAYTLVVEAVRRLWWAVQGIHDLHLRQEQAIDTLPPRLAKRLHEDFLPDAATIRKRLSGLMQPSRGWDIVLNTPVQMPTVEELMSADPGVRAVPPRLLPTLMEGRR